MRSRSRADLGVPDPLRLLGELSALPCEALMAGATSAGTVGVAEEATAGDELCVKNEADKGLRGRSAAVSARRLGSTEARVGDEPSHSHESDRLRDSCRTRCSDLPDSVAAPLKLEVGVAERGLVLEDGAEIAPPLRCGDTSAVEKPSASCATLKYALKWVGDVNKPAL